MLKTVNLILYLGTKRHAKKILLILLAFFISLPLRGTSIPFELAGEYQGLLRDPYQSIFSLEDALVIGMEGEIENARFYLAVGTKEEGLSGEKFLKLNTGKLKNIMDFRGPKVPDMPVDFVAFLLQRLFPSQDGLNVIPNQLSKDDPVRAFTPQTIGVTLNKIRDFYLNPPKDREKFKRDLAFAIDHNLNPSIPAFYDLGTSQKNEDAYVKREKAKKHKPILDFTTTLLFALDDATQHPFYTPYFVHKILFSFALQKAGRSEDPRSAMKAFYAAMPDVVQEDFKLQDPFSKKMYAELKGRLMMLYSYQTPFDAKQKAIETYGKDYRLSPREELCFSYGKKYFDSLFPKVHYTNTANYKGTSFSNCGEYTVLNWLNLFLFDFAQKSIRVEMLNKMEGVSKPLLEYFKLFPTEEAQQSKKGQEAWTSVTSGHSQKTDPDLYYHKGGGTCEILHGFTSMAALMRALFPDETNCLIRDNQLLTPLERAKATLQHLVDKFSNKQETWKWSVDQAEEGKEHDITKNDLVIHMVKSGKNVPMDGEEPITDPILSLTFNHGHYNASFSGGADDEYMELYGLSVLKSLPNLKRSLSELDFSLASPTLTSFFFDSVFGDDELDPRNLELGKIFSQLSEETQNRLHMRSVLRPSLQNTTLRMALFTYFVALKSSPFYLMAANLLESLPGEDPTVVSLFLLNCLDEDGNLVKPVKVQPRIDEKRSSICDSVKDPKFAYDCLILDMGLNKLSRHLMSHIPKGSLTKEQALQVIVKWSNDDDVDRALWETFIGRYGSVFIDELSGKIDPRAFLLHQPGGQGETLLNSILMESKDEVIQFFVESGWLTKEVVLDAL